MTDNAKDRRFLAGFAILLILLASAYIGGITFLPVPKENQSNANTVLGFLLGTLLGTIVTFFYGSSKSSQDKDATIKGIAVGPPPADPNAGQPLPWKDPNP